MSVHYGTAGGFKAVHPHDIAVLEDVSLRRGYGNEPGSSKRDKKMVSKKTKLPKCQK